MPSLRVLYSAVGRGRSSPSQRVARRISLWFYGYWGQPTDNLSYNVVCYNLSANVFLKLKNAVVEIPRSKLRSAPICDLSAYSKGSLDSSVMTSSSGKMSLPPDACNGTAADFSSVEEELYDYQMHTRMCKKIAQLTKVGQRHEQTKSTLLNLATMRSTGTIYT